MNLDDLAFALLLDLDPYPLHWERAQDIVKEYLEQAYRLGSESEHIKEE